MYPVACLQSSMFRVAPNSSYTSCQLMKPGVSVSTINPSKSKTIAASVILVVVSVAPEKWEAGGAGRRLSGNPPDPGWGSESTSRPSSALKADFEKFRIGKESFQLHDSILRAIGPV